MSGRVLMIFIAAVVLAPACVDRPHPGATREYEFRGPRPLEYEDAVLDAVTERFPDPAGVINIRISPPRSGTYEAPWIRIHGWHSYVSLNPPNRNGGYDGTRYYVVFFDEQGAASEWREITETDARFGVTR